MYKEIEGLNTMLDFLPKEISFFFWIIGHYDKKRDLEFI